MPQSLPDTRLHALSDRYDLVREVGRGGMASVHLARDLRHQREVAVKVLLPEVAESFGAARFLREIRLVARLQHPHILPLFDSGEADGVLYFVMPFVEGESLRTRLDREGGLELDDAVRIVRQVADALDYAHARGVVHRDLKPENVLLTEDYAHLADFGVAREPVGEGTGPATLTSVGITVGTPAYMSPEQAAAERNLDGRSDVYSLGCVCHEMLAGRPPFSGASALAIIRQHILGAPLPLVGARAALPDAVTSAVARALAKDPADRFPTAGAFAAALERAAVESRQPSVAELRLRAVERQQQTRQRVLVLDFVNLANAADADWLSTGIAETVSADLNKVAGVKVVGQDFSTRRRVEAELHGRLVDAELAAKLGRSIGAQWVVWGAFQKLGERIRITPHFVNTTDLTRLGGEKIDGVMDDIFALQDRIVTGLADALRIQLTSGEVERIEQPETLHLGAYEHYARGYRAYLRFGKESVKLAAEHFRAAISIDPQYALAQAGLGVIHGPMYIASGRREILNEGAQLLERAIELDPSIGEAYAWLAYMQFRQGRFDVSTRTAKLGVEREPANDMGWYMLGAGHVCHGTVAHEPNALGQAIPPLLRTVALNPGHLPAWLALGSIYLLRGQYSYATPAIDRAVELETTGSALTFLGALVQRAVLHMGVGDVDAARPLVEQAITRYTGADHVYAETMAAYAHVVRGSIAERTGNREAALEGFGRACQIADACEHRITIGAQWVKGRLGRARVLHQLGLTTDAMNALGEARELFVSRTRFVWTWIHGATDAEVLYELASTLITLGRTDEALDTLRQAADAGWADQTFLRHDPAFAAIRDSAAVRRIAVDASKRVDLPPPVGRGGVS
jgi:TolB-like protein/cytochrome c-type biogenesis protein CcmH/NrfG